MPSDTSWVESDSYVRVQVRVYGVQTGIFVVSLLRIRSLLRLGPTVTVVRVLRCATGKPCEVIG